MARTIRKRIPWWAKLQQYQGEPRWDNQNDCCNRDKPRNHWNRNHAYKQWYRENRRAKHKQHTKQLCEDFDNTPTKDGVEKYIKKLWGWFD